MVMPVTVVQRNADGSDMYVRFMIIILLYVLLFRLSAIIYPVPEPINKQVGDNINVTGLQALPI